jgi:hypothetical protein
MRLTMSNKDKQNEYSIEKQANNKPANTEKKRHACSGSQNDDFTNTLGNQVFNSLWMAKNRYRGKGVSEQKVTVHHVHVADGGQAILGSVER